MKHLFWLVDGQLAGRCGPDVNAWELAELKQAGIGAVLSLHDADNSDSQLFDTYQINYACIPVAHPVSPVDSDISICAAQLPKALAFIRQYEAENIPVLIHSYAGKDRTALLMAYYLMDNGAAPVHAVSQVRAICDVAFSAEGWDQFTFDVLYALQD